MIKRGKCDSSPMVVSFNYVCSKCGYTTSIEADGSEALTCPNCDSRLSIASSSMDSCPNGRCSIKRKDS